MGILHIEGFDYTDQTSEDMIPYSSSNKTIFVAGSSGYNYVGTSYARGDGAGYRMNHYAYCSAKVSFTDRSTVYTGIAFKINGNASYSATYFLMSFEDETDTDVHVRLHINSDNKIVARNAAGTIVGTSTSIISVGDWNHLEVKVYCHSTAGTIDVKINGVNEINLTSQDTQDLSSTIGMVKLGGVYNTTNEFDDWWIADDQWYGDCRVITVRPDSDETHTDFTPSAGSNYQNVDDAKIDDDTTYNQSSVEGDKDSFGVTLPSAVSDVLAVQLSNYVRKTSGATAKVKNLIRSNSTDYNSTEELTLNESYNPNVSLHLLDPGDSNPWTKAKVEAAEFGVEVTAISTTTTT